MASDVSLRGSVFRLIALVKSGSLGALAELNQAYVSGILAEDRVGCVVGCTWGHFLLLISLLVQYACGSGNEAPVETDIEQVIHTNNTTQSVVVAQPGSLLEAQQFVVDTETPSIGAATEIDASETVEEARQTSPIDRSVVGLM